MKQNQAIHIILTGGTIDSLYNQSTGRVEPAQQSCIPEYIESVIKPHLPISFETLCMLDSKEITQEIRETLVKAIQRSTAQKILIVHGTDTMVETLEYLENKITNKTLILTGSMIPLKQFILSDGGFNLGYALAQLQTLENGSYLCMNAQTFKAGEVQKDFKNARFEKTRH